MCRPSCCDKPRGQGAGIAAVALIIGAALVAAKIGPIVARIVHIVLEVLRIAALTAARSSQWPSQPGVIVLHRALVAAPPRRATGRRSQADCQLPWATGQAGDRPMPAWPAAATAKCSGPSATARYRAAAHARCASPLSWRGDHHAAVVRPQPPQQPVHLDRAFVQVHHSAAGVIWRFRTELAVLAAGSPASGNWPGRHHYLGGGHPHRHRQCVITVLPLDPAVHHPPGLVRAVPPPHPAGLLRDPDAHPVRAAAPGAAHPPHRGRGTRTDLVPRRDLRRGLRGAHGRDRRRLLRPPGPGRGQPAVGAARHRWTSCAATPSPRTTSSPPACVAGRSDGRQSPAA